VGVQPRRPSGRPLHRRLRTRLCGELSGAALHRNHSPAGRAGRGAQDQPFLRRSGGKADGPGGPKIVNATFKTVMLWMSLLVVIFLAWHFAQIQKREQPLRFSEFMAQVEAGQIREVTITANETKPPIPTAHPTTPYA